MFPRWQTLVKVPALCALVAGGFSSNGLQAQCCHGGMRPGLSPGLIAQQLLQTQQLLQQQQLLLQVQQQQLLQTARLNRQIDELAKQGPEAIKSALKDPKPEMRFIAALAAAKNGPGLEKELVERLTDDNASVRQAARRGLVTLSTVRDGKPNRRRSVDFGPTPTANRTAQKTAARKWSDWLDRQQKRKDELKTAAAQTTIKRATVPAR
jgi:hypothetical protein